MLLPVITTEINRWILFSFTNEDPVECNAVTMNPVKYRVLERIKHHYV